MPCCRGWLWCLIIIIIIIIVVIVIAIIAIIVIIVIIVIAIIIRAVAWSGRGVRRLSLWCRVVQRLLARVRAVAVAVAVAADPVDRCGGRW